MIEITLKYIWDSGQVYPDGGNISWLGTNKRYFSMGVNSGIVRWYSSTFGHDLMIERSGHRIRDDITREVITVTMSQKEYALMCLKFA